MVYPGAARVGDDEEPGHDPHLPDDRVAGWRPLPRSTSAGAYCEPHVRELASIRDIVAERSCRRSGRSRDVPAADGAFYCLLRVNTSMRSDAARRATGARAQGRGDSRARRSG